jgi:hypothetical protein
MYPQNAFNLITRIAEGKVETLEKVLDAIQKEDVETNPYFPFIRITTIHFARFVILHKIIENGKEKFPPYLVLSTNYDGDLDNHLADIIANTKTNNGFDAIFSCCENFPQGNVTDAERLRFLKEGFKHRPYFYRGIWGRTVGQINREQAARDAIEDFLDKHPMKDLTPEQIKSRILENFKTVNYKIESETIPPPKPTGVLVILAIIALILLYTIFYGLYYLGAAIGSYEVKVFIPPVLHYTLITLMTSFIILVIAFIVILRFKEKHDQQMEILYDPDDEKTKSMKEHEDHIVQNQLTHLVELKPGWFRLFSLKLVLFLVETAGIYYYNKGKLGRIPTIHFARWIIIDGGKRLLFFSNYDGSWENYLGDFIDKASVGLTGVWSNTIEFPKSKFLFGKGATDEQRFKSWTRKYQIPTQVWYSAHKYLTVENINNNSAIIKGLNENLKGKDLTSWLLKL